MAEGTRKRTAGLFDIRNVIGALLGIYGLVLLLVGLFGGSETEDSTVAGDSANIWVGIALLLAAAFFMTWTRLRPTVVDDSRTGSRAGGSDGAGTAAGQGPDGP